MNFDSVSLRGQKNSFWSMLYLGALGLLFVAGFGGNQQSTWAQSSTAPTVINIGTTVKQANVKRLGINISGQDYWDSGQMLRNLTFNNPGFEAQQWQTILTCSAVSGNTCTDGNGWSQWPANFLQGGTFEFIYGSAKGQTGTIVSMTASSMNGGAGSWFNFGSAKPAVGDVFIIRKNIPGSPDAGWWPSTSGGATITADTTDLSPNTPGKQAVSLNAGKSGQTATETSWFDSENGRNFILLNGTYTITFRAKSAGGSNLLNVSVGRGNSYFNQNVALTTSWQDYSYTFTANETTAQSNEAYLSFSVSGGTVLLDDAALTESASANNPTAFRNAVVERLQQLNPGVLRYMDSGTDFGSSIDNMIAVPDARLRSGALQNTNEMTMVPLGLEEFLVLCQAVGAEPWFTVPMNIDPADMQNLIQFLAGASSTTYGAKRAALGQSTPWTSVFPVIHLEIGNEEWNYGFTGEMIPNSAAYGSRGGAIFAAAKAAPGYSETAFDLILDGQAVNPLGVGQNVLNSASSNYDTIDAAPYIFDGLTDYSSNEAIFGSMFAEPEMVDSTPNGYMYQQMQMASGQTGGLTGKAANLAAYEVSLGTVSGTAPQSVVNSVVPSLGGGLAVADHMLLMMRDDGILTQNLFALPGYEDGFNNANGGSEVVQLWGSVVDMGGPTNCSRPIFLAEQLANTAIAGNMLATSQTGNNPTWNVNSPNSFGINMTGAHYIQSFAFANGTENSLVLFNLSRTTALPVTFAGANAPTGLVQVGLLTSANITDNNETKSVVAIQNSTIQNFNPLTGTTLPPFSMTVYQWSTSGGVTPPTPVATTTALSATPVSATVGQSVTITATVKPASGSVATGTISFLNGGTSLGTVALSGGQATLTTSTLTAGSHSLTATYEGSSSDGGSTSSPVVVTVTAPAIPTTTTKLQAPTQATDGETATFTATVTAKSGSTPTGTVSFLAGTTVLGTASLSNGTATYTLSPVNLAAGSYSVTAKYAGNTSDGASTSGATTMTVEGAVESTTTTAKAPAQVTDGNTATLTATVKASSGSTPTGTVTFLAGSTVLGTASLSGGSASYVLSPVTLAAGTYNITASYTGTASDSASTSAAVTMRVVSAVAATTTALQAPAQVTDGQSATITATVSAASGTTPTGSITFAAGSTILSTVALSSGKASYTMSPVSLPAGTYTVTATYAATSTDSASSASASIEVVAAPVTTTTTVTAPSTATDGQTATLTATVVAASGSPIGTVTFKAGSTVLGTASLVSGKATYSLSPVSLAAGSYSITAVYAGSSTDSGSTSPAATMKVVGAVESTTTKLVLSATSVKAGQSMSGTVTVSASAGATPTGTVNFYVDTTLVGTAQLSSGKAVFTTNADLSPGTYQASVNYGGSSSDSASSSPKLNFTVVADTVATTTSLSSSTTKAAVGTPITLTATVTPQTSGVSVSGAVTFYLGQTALGTGQLASGQAVLQIASSLAAGTYELTAVYAGNSTDLTSTSNTVTLTITPDIIPTSVQLAAAATKLTAGQSTTLMAKVIADANGTVPTGTVNFYLGQTQVSSATLSGGSATSTFAANMTPGTYQLTAAYTGTSQDSASSSAPLTITIAPSVVATTTSLVSSASQLTQGQEFSLTASVAADSGTATPQGNITFYLGQTQIGSATLSAGKATLAMANSFGPGTYQVTAKYGGSNVDSGSVSAPLTLTISPAISATSTTLTASSTQLAQGQSFSLTATVAATGSNTKPEGNVSFYLGQTQIGSAILSNGSATLTVANSFAAGTYQVTAVYGGNSQDSASTSNPVSLTVAAPVTPAQQPISTNTVLAVNPQQPTVGETVAIHVQVGAVGSTLPVSGTVNIYMGQTLVGSANLAAGSAIVTMQAPAAGTYTVMAAFAGQSEFLASQSTPVTFTVQANSASTPVTPSAPSGTFTIGLSSKAVTLGQAQSASLQVILAAVQGYKGTVQLNCAGLPAGYTCNFSPAAVAIAGSQATSTLSLSPNTSTAYNSPMLTNIARVMVLPWDIFGIFGSIFGRRRFQGRCSKLAVLGMLIFSATFWMTGCGLTVNNVTQPYQVTVTADSQNQGTQTTTFTLYVIQPAAKF